MQKKSNNRMLVIYVKRSYTEKENNLPSTAKNTTGF